MQWDADWPFIVVSILIIIGILVSEYYTRKADDRKEAKLDAICKKLGVEQSKPNPNKQKRTNSF